MHQTTMMDRGPQGLVRLAAETGLDRICLFTSSPQREDGTNMFPCVAADEAGSFRALLRGTGVRIINAEYFPVMAGRDVERYLPEIELAADLGAKRIVTHMHETDPERAVDQLSALCRLAGVSGLDVGLEFTGFAGGCSSLADAVALHGQVNRPNLKIAVDALHLFRTGGTLEQLQAVDPNAIAYAQLCDGPDLRQTDDYLDEAMNRMVPGDGVFPLTGFVALLGTHVDIDIEVPCSNPGAGAESWARRAITASRHLLREES